MMNGEECIVGFKLVFRTSKSDMKEIYQGHQVSVLCRKEQVIGISYYEINFK